MRVLYSNPQRKDERGTTIVLYTLALSFVILPMIGLAIDGGVSYLARTRLNSAVDAAVLAGGRSLSVGLDFNSQKANAEEIAQQYFRANFPDNYLGAKNITVTAEAKQNGTAYRTVSVKASADIPLYFLPVVGIPKSTPAVSAQSSRRDVNVILTLDRSGSMVGVCKLLISNAQNFINGFTDGRDELGLITFMGNPSLDYAPTVHFKTQNPTMSEKVNNLVCSNSTGSAAALELAQAQFSAITRPGALNIIVFFTDGAPNGFNGNFLVKSGSACNSPAKAVIGEVNNGGGLYIINPLQTISTGFETPYTQNGCKFYNTGNLQTQLDSIPKNDLGGVSSLGYLAVSFDGNGNISLAGNASQNIQAVSSNAADNAARIARQSGTLIYTIGLGSNGGVDSNFLRRVANDRASTTFDPSQPIGRYAYASDAGQLAAAFASIQSEILRISQ